MKIKFRRSRGLWKWMGYNLSISVAQPIWYSLIMWGARAGGLRETNSIAFQMDEDLLPSDTQAGTQEENFISNKCGWKHFSNYLPQ
ncbi:hypothetical protein NQ317_014195 [Molorchus minor]|uniref:POPLD domain-containing protein n=1 Tax=Molorchus minor TaxID=1323400 RepID=A0ABQ9JIX5_9CUCU|nr:hypothetical protein NQ317_014195 [Molorchus minor]